MGEAKRKREAVLNGPCPCGLGKPARVCCFNGRDWHKKPAVLGLKTLPPASSLAKCYMNSLGSCVGPISGEHLISESVIRILMADGDFSISGLPRLVPGEEKLLAPMNLTANCLCVKHNSALHPLDDAAKYFFTLLKSFFEAETGLRHALVSGHDIERWLLKTAKVMAVSKNFARGRERLPGVFSRDEALLDMLDNHEQWPDATGLYCIMNTGDTSINEPRFKLQPLTNDREEIEALELSILGLRFVLLLGSPDEGKHIFLRGAKYRPGRIVISSPKSNNWLTISWSDRKVHEPLTMQFVRRIQESKRET
jgi:hypothetical protein